MRPVFLFFHATEPEMVDGKKDFTKVKACEEAAAQFKIRALANCLREFACIRIDVSKARPQLMKILGVHEAPTCMALDLDSETACFVTGAFEWGDIELDLVDCIEETERKIRTLAGGDEKSPETAAAGKRLAAIEIREAYERVEKLFQRAQWDKAKTGLRKLAKTGALENFFVKRVPVMLAEIDAAALYFEAVEDLKAERTGDAKEKLERIVYELKEAPWFRRFARATLGKL
ncbi:MAG: hypothetical protein ACYTFG_00685 [Planctomycetota bacterium]